MIKPISLAFESSMPARLKIYILLIILINCFSFISNNSIHIEILFLLTKNYLFVVIAFIKCKMNFLLIQIILN